MKYIRLILMMCVCWSALSACAAPGVDPSKSIEQVRIEGPKMSKSDLEKICKAYVQAIIEAHAESARLEAQLRAIPYSEILGDQANAIKTKLSDVAGRLVALNLHYDAYSEFYQQKGGDYEKIKLPR